MNLKIERIKLEGPELSQAYIENYPAVGSYYLAGPPSSIESYRQLAETIRSTTPATRWTQLPMAVGPTDPRVKARLEQLVEGRGLFVATGQQAGLFLGPLYTIYKALTAARLADQLERRLGIPVMPLFSIASEDHDWAEVDHTYIIDTENRLVRLQLKSPLRDGPQAPTPSVEHIRLGPDIEDALGVLVQATPNSEFKVDILDPLRAAYRPGRGLAEAFRAALGHLLRRYCFLLVPTAHPHVKRETRGIMWQEWERRQESEARLKRRANELVAAGFRPQVSIASGATNLFVEGELGRDRLLYDDGGVRSRRSGETASEAELRRWLDDTPERVSPGALLRPVTEAAAFPVIAYVGGPGEIAYLAQSQVLFDLHDIPAPVVVPRSAFRLVEAKVARVLSKYNLEAAWFSGDSRGAINRLLDEQAPSEVQNALAQLRRSVADRLKDLEAAALEFDPGSKSALGSGASAVFDGISMLETKLQARVREKNQVMQQQLEKAALNLYPEGRPQERVLNAYPFLVRYGEKLVDELYDATVTPLADGDDPRV